MEEYLSMFNLYFPKIIIAMLILAVGFWASGRLCKMIIKAMRKTNIESSISSFSYSGLKVTFRLIVVLIAISALGVNTSSIVAALGASLVTVGLALKDSLSNVASGFLIIVNKPFKVNDYLETDKFSGTVNKIELMFTTLVTPDNKEVVVPNALLTSSHVINCTAKKTRKIDLSFSISKDSNFETQKEKIRSIVTENPNILKDNCEIYTEKINDGSIDVKVNAWCNTKDYSSVIAQIKDKVNYAILEPIKEVKQ